MKTFGKPVCEVIRFNSGFIATSTCACYDEDLGVLPKNCTGDVSYCACGVNHSPASDNCTPCSEWQE